MTHHVYLVPGFFGFTNLGRLRYFLHVHDALRRRGLRVHVVRTHPTASLPRRAARIAETIADTLPRGGVAHLVGHSTGGLDARLFATPGVTLPTAADVDHLAARLGAIVTVASPHHGAPLASALSSVRGQQLIAMLSLGTSYVLRFGHLPLSAVLQIGALFRGATPPDGQGTLLDDLTRQLLTDFSIGRRRAVQRLLGEVVRDQSLLPQLAPEAMEVFNATVHDRPGVRYGAVVTRARPPGVRSTFATGLDAGAQAMHGIYQAIYRLSSTTRRGAEAPLTGAQRRSPARSAARCTTPTAACRARTPTTVSYRRAPRSGARWSPP